jgi:tetratricopeptide (TPR) repeat protein
MRVDMSLEQNTLSKAFHESCGYLLSLHQLRIEGKHDSDEADLIREQSEKSWNEMSDLEQELFRGISEDLYSISDPVPELQPINPQVQKNLTPLRQAFENGDWQKILELLRRWKNYIPLSKLSIFRSIIWREWREPKIALEFARHASFLEPDNQDFKSQWLNLLAVVEPERAASEAEKIADSCQNYSAEICYHALLLLLKKAAQLRDSDYWQKLIPFAESVVELSQRSKIFQSIPESIQITLDILANCFKNAGMSQKALEIYEIGIRKWPSYPGFWAGRGILTYELNPEKAVVDLERATSSRVTPAPLLLLAHYNMVTGNFLKALAYIDQRLSISISDQLRSDLFMWKAMALAKLGGEQTAIEKLFEDSIHLNPKNETAIRYRDLFIRSLSDPELLTNKYQELKIESPWMRAELSTPDLPKNNFPQPKFDLAA